MDDPLSTFVLERDVAGDGFVATDCETGPCRMCVEPLPDDACTPMCDLPDALGVNVDKPSDIHMQPSELLTPHTVNRVAETCKWVGNFTLSPTATRNSQTVTGVRYTFTADVADARSFLIEMLNASGATVASVGYSDTGSLSGCGLRNLSHSSGDTDWGSTLSFLEGPFD